MIALLKLQIEISVDSFKCIPFLDYIYKDCNIFLDRKYEKYKYITKLPMYAEMYTRNSEIKQGTPPLWIGQLEPKVVCKSTVRGNA